MEVTGNHLKFPPDYNEVRPKTEEPAPIENANEPHCPSCNGRWRFDEYAQTSISIMMHCQQPWIVVYCPQCMDAFMITGCGKTAVPEETAIAMHVDQFWIAKLVHPNS